MSFLSNTTESSITVVKKPPVFPKLRTHLYSDKIKNESSSTGSSRRVRSASTGRDKKSEIQARYWAFLFGNLQRAINEIYETVECYENMSSCQETILVLENYIRDFKALGEWFRVSWDYESTPLPQRPNSLAWEIRKSNPVPRLHKNFSSPLTSGKSSPNFSGKSSPCSTIDDNKFSPKKFYYLDTTSKNAVPKLNIKQLFGNKPISKEFLKEHTEPQIDFQHINDRKAEFEESQPELNFELNEIRESSSVHVIENELGLKLEKCDNSTQTDLEDENLTLAEIREKLKMQSNGENSVKSPILLRSSTSDTLKNKVIESQDNICKKTENIVMKTEKKIELNSAKILEPTKQIDKNLKKQISPVKYSTILNKNISNKPVSKTTTLKNNKNFVRSTCALDIAGTTNELGSAKTTSKSLSNKSNITLNNFARSISNFNTNFLKTNPQHSSNLYKTERWKSSTNERVPFRSKTMIDLKNTKKPLVSKTSISYGRLSRASNRSINNSCEIKNELKSSNLFDTSNTNLSNQKQQIQNSNDGWLTVKTKRKSSSHWTQRFNQPTGYASLPALPLLNEEIEKKIDTVKTVQQNDIKSKKEVKPINKVKISVPPTKNSGKHIAKTSARDNKSSNMNTTIKNRQTLIKRQKSDLTGLKITSLHKEYMQSKKFNESDKSTENAQNKNSKNKISDECALSDDIDVNKIDIKIQTNREFSKAIGDLYDSLLMVPNFNRCDVNLSSCDEYEERDDIESDEDQRKLLEEQELLEKQILELQNTEIDVDTETDETDCEVMIDLDDCNEKTLVNDCSHDSFTIPEEEEDMSLEMRYYPLFSEMSNCERKETLATLQAYVSRYPGRAQELHQKLSSPSRRRSLQETLRKYQAKQARAQEKRELLQKEKTLKIQQLLARVEDVKTAKSQLIEKRRLRMEERLKKATLNRNQYLRDIVRKAHDEEEKLKEIAFIKNLEAQNKRLDFLEACKEHEGRLQDLEQERQKKVEEKAAKEAAVERRRQEIEKARQRRLEKMNESRIEREQRIGKMQEQREKQRIQMAREKAKDREERLLALQAQQQQTQEELQKKIIQKQIESARRHEENIEHIRQRALELSIPSRNLDDCINPIPLNKIPEDDKPEDAELSSTPSDVSKENSKNYKKKLRKLKQRMAQNAEEYMKQLPPLPIHIKRESQVPKFLNLVTKGGGPLGMERQFNQLLRIIKKGQINDFQCFWLLDGLGTITNFLIKAIENPEELNTRTTILAVQVFRDACCSCPQIARHSLLGNTIAVLFDALVKSCQYPEVKSNRIAVPLSVELMLACTVALSPSNSKKHAPNVLERIPDLIPYVIMTGLIGILSRRSTVLQDNSIENQQSAVLSLLSTIGLLTKFTEICPQDVNDPTHFLSTIKATELFGIIQILNTNVIPVGEAIPQRIISLAAAAFNLIISIAVLDINTFQSVLTAESLISMKYLDVVSMLLKYCGPKCIGFDNSECQAMLVDLIASIGFFCANNEKNQNLLITTPHCVILKNLKNLPEKFNIVVFPCVVTIINGNEKSRKALSNYFDLNLFDEYRKSDKAKKNHLIALLKER